MSRNSIQAAFDYLDIQSQGGGIDGDVLKRIANIIAIHDFVLCQVANHLNLNIDEMLMQAQKEILGTSSAASADGR